MFPATARFRPIALVGRGSMGAVYRAYDAETDSEVALKTLGALEPERLYQLKSEFRVLAGIVHPNLVDLYELIVDETEGFFTMEFVEGVDFLAYMRAGDGTLDLGRCVKSARQLVAGLAAVHAAGRLHRDVKPGNVRVTPAGRVVVLDFGLATVLERSGRTESERGLAGTPAYMAPELLWGKEAEPATDWYSAGVVLFEALTGRLPFSGQAGLLRVAQGRRAPAVRSLVSEAPERLDALIGALLDPEAARRPAAREILAALDEMSGDDADGAPIDWPAAPSEAARDAPFVGREAELAALRAAYDEARHGATIVARIVGPSGIGKSEVGRRFLASIAGEPEALVLRGRCHLQEALPYNALDPIVDALSRILLDLSLQARAPLVSRQWPALVRLFPVLGSVMPLSREGGESTAEPHEVRRQGFAALRGLLGALGRERAMVLWIDDAQWADLDSAALLRELLRPPDAPPLLLVLSYRDEHGIPLLDTLDGGELGALPQVRLDLEPLSAEEARRLAELLAPSDERRFAAIAEESGGSPFLIGELARHLGERGAASVGASLTDAVAARAERLSPAARRVLELVCVAGRPLERGFVLRAAGVGERGRPLLSVLGHVRLLRNASLSDKRMVEAYHDRIAESLLAYLAPSDLRDRHAALADALLDAPEPDPELVFVHALGAGRRDEASGWAERAAERAAATLAFARAAGLYRQAIDLREPSRVGWRLRAGLAAALANCGRSVEAAGAYERAAAVLAEQDPNESADLDLRRRAAEQYLRSGRLVEGSVATRRVLAAVGLEFPANRRRALAAVAAGRVRLAWRGLSFRPRPPHEIPASVRRRLDASWGAAMSLSVLDQTLADGLGVRHLLDALAAGEPSHAARALGIEAIKSRQIGGWFFRRRAARILDLLEEFGTRVRDPYDRAFLMASTGATAYEEAAWRRAHELCDEGARIFREECTGATWETVTCEAFSLSALGHMGELRDLGRRLPAVIADADDRGDLYAGIGFRAGVLNLVWLAQDRPDIAREQIDTAMTRWPQVEGFLIQHYLHLIAAVHIDLYVGDVWAAWARINHAWPRLRRAQFLLMESPGVELRNLRARAALGAAAADPDALPAGATRADPSWPRARLLAVARRDARALARRSIASAAPFAALVRAGIAEIEGRTESALAALESATRGFERAEMALYASAASDRSGALLGGERGASLRRRAEAWTSCQGILRGWALWGMCFPARRR